MKYLILFLTLLLTSQTIAQQKIYKWTDADGKVHFTEKKPVDTQVKEIKVNTSKSKPKTNKVETSEEKTGDTDTAAKSKDQQAVDEYNKSEQERVSKLQNQENCKVAKKNLSTLERTNRVRKVDPTTGESVRMDDTQRNKALDAARKLIKDVCN